MKLNKEVMKEKIYEVKTYNENQKYVQIKIINLKDKQTMIQMNDVSKDVLYNKEKSQNELLSLINATVSHEMRNPLNSINSQCIENKALFAKLDDIVQQDEVDINQIKLIVKKLLVG